MRKKKKILVKKKPLSLNKMVKAKMYMGHTPNEWNPHMQNLILGEKQGYHVIDVVQTLYNLKDVLLFIQESAKQNKKFLFIGTDKVIAPLIKEVANLCKSFYVNNRWFGGMLTNWKTIQQSLVQFKSLKEAEISGQWKFLKKKEVLKKKAKLLYLEKNLIGLDGMENLPHIAIIIGQVGVLTAINECKKLGITTITFLDTNCNPVLTDWNIPGNDDSYLSNKLILNFIKDSILFGQKEQVNISEDQKQVDSLNFIEKSILLKKNIFREETEIFKAKKAPIQDLTKKNYNSASNNSYRKFNNTTINKKSYNKFNKYQHKHPNNQQKKYFKYNRFNNKNR